MLQASFSQKDLQENGIWTWYAPKEIKAGQKLHEQIESESALKKLFKVKRCDL